MGSEDKLIVEAAQHGVGDGAGIGIWNWSSLPDNQPTGSQDFTADRLEPNVGTANPTNMNSAMAEFLRVRHLTDHLTYEGLAAIHIPGYSTTKADKEPFAVYKFTPVETYEANKFAKTIQSYGKEYQLGFPLWHLENRREVGYHGANGYALASAV